MRNTEQGLMIDGLLDMHAIDGWDPIVDTMERYAQRRPVSGALVILCVFGHQEKTPSLWLYPSERYICYGCGCHGTRGEFIAEQNLLKPSNLLIRLGMSVPEPIKAELDVIYDTEIQPRHLGLDTSTIQPDEEPF